MAKDDKKEEEKPKLSLAKQIAASVAAINNKYAKEGGPPVIMRASAATRALKIARIEYGILDVDYMFGGGIPRGRIVMFIGNESSGKTTMALLAIAGAQAQCHHCGGDLYRKPTKEWPAWEAAAHEAKVSPFLPPKWFVEEHGEKPVHYDYFGCGCETPNPLESLYQDVEGTLDLDWCEALGVDTDHVHVIKTEFAEQGIDVSDAMMRSRNFDIQVVDSVAHLTPMKELEQSAESSNEPGLQARLVNKACRGWVSVVNSFGIDNDGRPAPLIILINHEYLKIGGYGNPVTLRGGRNQLYVTSVTVRMNNPEYVMKEKGGQTWAERVKMKFTGKKNKVGPPRRSGSFEIFVVDVGNYKKGHVAETKLVLLRADQFGLIVHPDSPETKREKKRAEEEPITMWSCLGFEEKTKQALVEKLKQPEVWRKLRRAVLDKMLGI